MRLDGLDAGGEPTGSTRLDALHALVDEHLGTVRTEFGRFGRQVSGYSFEHLLPERGRRLDRFLVGTEGTLGVVLDATVRLVEDAPRRALAVLGYPTMADAADAVPAAAARTAPGRLRGARPAHRRHGPRRAAPSRAARAAAAGCSPRSPATTAGGGAVAAQAVVAATPARSAHRIVTDTVEQLALWRIREDGAGLAAAR